MDASVGAILPKAEEIAAFGDMPWGDALAGKSPPRRGAGAAQGKGQKNIEPPFLGFGIVISPPPPPPPPPFLRFGTYLRNDSLRLAGQTPLPLVEFFESPPNLYFLL